PPDHGPRVLRRTWNMPLPCPPPLAPPPDLRPIDFSVDYKLDCSRVLSRKRGRVNALCEEVWSISAADHAGLCQPNRRGCGARATKPGGSGCDTRDAA